MDLRRRSSLAVLARSYCSASSLSPSWLRSSVGAAVSPIASTSRDEIHLVIGIREDFDGAAGVSKQRLHFRCVA